MNMSSIENVKRLIDQRIAQGNFRKELLDLIPNSSRKVLEFGYGDGTLLLAAKLFKNLEHICGIDIKESEAAQFFDAAWHSDLSVEENSIDEAYHGFFDCIFSSNTMEHVYDPWRVLSKLRRYMTPDGLLIVETPNIQCWESLYRIAVGEFPYTSGAHFDSTHIRWYTVHSFAEMLDFIGFEPQDIYPLTFGAELDFLDKINEMYTLELPPPGVDSDAPKIVLKFPVNIKPLYPFYVAPRFIITARRGSRPLYDRHAGYHAEFEEFRLQSQNRYRLIPQLIQPPVNTDVAQKLSKRLGRPVAKTL